MIAKWFGFGTMRLIRNIKINTVLALIAVGRVAKAGWATLQNRELFPNDFAQETNVLRPE